MAALPDNETAPLAFGSSTMIAGLTVMVLVLPLLARKLPSPEYKASIDCEPGGRLDVTSAATPPERVTVPRVSLVVVSEKVTDPVGVPEPGAFAVTVAVNVIDKPNEPLEVEAFTLVELASCVIVRLTELEVLFWSFASPP